MKFRELEKLLLDKGYVSVRCSGSHNTYKKDGEARLITVPFHNKDFKPGTLNKILKDIGVK